MVEGLVSVHSDLVAAVLVGEGHGELNTGHQTDGVVRASFAGEGASFRERRAAHPGVLGAGGALDVEVHAFSRAEAMK